MPFGLILFSMNLNLFKFAHTVVLHEKTKHLSVGIYLFKVNIGNTRTMREIYSKLNNSDTKIKSAILDFLHCSGVCIVEFEQENVG